MVISSFNELKDTCLKILIQDKKYKINLCQ